MVIENKEKLEEEFLVFLRETGFPDDAIFRGPSFPQIGGSTWRSRWLRWLRETNPTEAPLPSCYADLAILDLDCHEYAALIHFRLEWNEQVEQESIDFFGNVLGGLTVKPPVYLVTPAPGIGFRIHQMGEQGLHRVLVKKDFPGYRTLEASLAAQKTLVRESKQERALDRFTMTCHSLAGGLGLLVLASISGLTRLDPGELLLSFLVALLAVAPQALGLRRIKPSRRPRDAS